MKSPTLDRQAAATFLAGALLIAISFLTNYGHGALLHLSTLSLDEQIGVSLHIAALAALFGDAELATRLRDRTRNKVARARQREIRRLIAAIRFQLADTPRSRLTSDGWNLMLFQPMHQSISINQTSSDTQHTRLGIININQ
ncbi:MAG: hypothetical protein KXJ49_00430 [Vulcanococcus sp.]|jgi:hypothetical protein|uniref:hypothetical protein n=1 Tax=Vulcanococcus sp. TaxID=2856995 RepID=UPI0025EB39BE|nr:hypothetical protein [Vulcanococcus sp.]MBW0165948.1 hypothetical protein [Vulcanococcus sp.]